jgi:hypothetical protein
MFNKKMKKTLKKKHEIIFLLKKSFYLCIIIKKQTLTLKTKHHGNYKRKSHNSKSY